MFLFRVLLLGMLPLMAGGCGMQALDAGSSIDNFSEGGASFKSAEKASTSSDKPTKTSAHNSQDTSSSLLASSARNSAVQKVALTLSSTSDPASGSYKIGPLDMLEITVFKVTDLSKTAQVSEAGTFTYPLIGEVHAAGKTAREVELKIKRELGEKYLQNPQVTVLVKEYNSQRVTIEGAVKRPGVYPIAGGLTLLQLVARAEGFEQTAEESVLVLRKVNGKRSIAKFDLSDIRKGKTDDPQLLAGDVIVAPTSDVKEGLNVILKFAPLTTVFTAL